MTNTRANVYAAGEWAAPVLWYAKGVAAMQQRALKDPTGWRFWGAMHGFDAPIWRSLGYLKAGEQRPASAVARKYWKQCQHQTWYFLPWHRGYLLAFEAVVRAAVVELGGPSDWALPYWNYFAPHQAALPPAFASATWPGNGPNPLFVSHRYGPHDDGHVFVPVGPGGGASLQSLADPQFTGGSTGASPGFGGVDTGFSHQGSVQGGLESQPHNAVHVFVGGSDPADPSIPGLMTDPDTAALDPIFWLHHANIDRLWEIWNRGAAGHPHPDPTDPHWAQGPASVGQRVFAMPRPDGTTWTFTPHEMVGLPALGYQYDNLSPTGAAAPPPPAPHAVAAEGVLPVPPTSDPELVGATTASIALEGQGAAGDVHLDAGVRRAAAATFAAAPAADAADVPPPHDPGTDRVFLDLENVRGPSDALAFHVYLGLAPDADPAAHPELLAGTVAPFGLRKASDPDGEHGGQGMTFVLDVTDLATRLHLASSFDVDLLPVRLVPTRPVREGTGLTVGRISLYRQAS